MDKKEYEAPIVQELGDVKEFTKALTVEPQQLDAAFENDTPFEDLTWS